ncbi:MAG: deoxyguanosinetriphosphate triphosphohydrolase [Alphaproteobacteria bacterium]
MMTWSHLLSSRRLNRTDTLSSKGRSAFQQDLDRIVFCSAFRRLQNKTQVHPLTHNDHVRTRLSHSVEVASVGRSLGTIVGSVIAPRLDLDGITADSFGHIVQAACLAHDIGNPPFGHAGEDALQDWFAHTSLGEQLLAGMTTAERRDLEHFDGNAQGFRILTQLEQRKWNGGLQLTLAALGAFTKYPRTSTAHMHSYPGSRKVGIFQSELPYFTSIAENIRLKKRGKSGDAWARHPLTYLMEAADDICYSIIDIEDGAALGHLSYVDAEAILLPIARISRRDLGGSMNEKLSHLRAKAIGNLIDAVAEVFLKEEESLLAGTFAKELIDCTRYAAPVAHAKKTAHEQIFTSREKTARELAGASVITGLLDMLAEVPLVLSAHRFNSTHLKGRTSKLARLIRLDEPRPTSLYQATLRITDYITGMTDRFATDLYRNLRGLAM